MNAAPSTAPNGVTLVCFALKEEAAPFRKLRSGSRDPEILVTGIGKRNARSSVESCVANLRPVLVLTCGFAGGLNPDLRIGDVVCETIDSALAQRLAAAGARPAKFHCADRIAVTAGEKRQLREATAADVVEMESGAIQELCRERGISCATLRVISDTVDEDLPLDFNRLSKPDSSLDFGKLLGAVARSPGKIGALLRLQRQTRFAAEKLAAVLAAFMRPG